MKQQVVVIGGGIPFETYRDYISFLKNCEFNLDLLRPHFDWKNTLAENLGAKFDVFVPRMPSIVNAKYKEWKISFQRALGFLTGEPIFIGHSLGGVFLAKYFSENKFPKKIKTVILVAAPFDDKGSSEKLASFALSKPLTRFAAQTGKICLVYSQDDPLVPFTQLKKYQEALPGAKSLIFKNRGHFNQRSFPEIVRLLKDIK